MIKKLLRILGIAGLAGGMAFAATSSGAQNDTTITTLSALVGGGGPNVLPQTLVCLASATGVVTPSLSTGQTGSILAVDSEAMQVLSSPSTACYLVHRGVLGSVVTPHNSGASVWVGNAATSTGDTARPFSNGAFVSSAPSGSCVPANQFTLPVILFGEAYGYRAAGTAYTCFATSSTATGNWGVLGGTYYGGTVASVAGLQWLSGMQMTISGTNAITGFTIPNGFPSGACLAIFPTGAFTTTTANNIAAASTAVANKTLFECWNGSKFVPSY